MKSAVFLILFSSVATAEGTAFSPDFLFGLATAPAHVEDQLADTWADWADQNRVAAFSPELQPKERLRFWTEPEVELDLAARTGIQVFRMGIDWGRLAPHRPGSDDCAGICPEGIQDLKALARYKEIIALAKARKLRVMLTLFHHSGPRWFAETEGWQNPQTIQSFRIFAQQVIREFEPDVDYWITFNEPTIYSLLTYVEGIWPFGDKGGLLAMLDLGFYKGRYATAMDAMAEAHRLIYSDAHAAFPNVRVGISQHISYLVNSKNDQNFFYDVLSRLWNWSFTEQIRGSMDFYGMNYYGAEHPLAGGELLEDQEYSEAGRAIAPEGLYVMSKQAHERYGLPIFVTENGIADSTDYLRPAYLTEHLAALLQAQSENVKILGYIFWTISDNWEWADGYCPKFGLVAVDRRNNLLRTPRASYDLFQKIVTSRTLSDVQREQAWSLVSRHRGEDRPMCRAPDGVGSLNEPTLRKIKSRDWRFRGHGAKQPSSK